MNPLIVNIGHSLYILISCANIIKMTSCLYITNDILNFLIVIMA